MKEIIKKIVIGVLAVIVVVGIAAYFLKGDGPSKVEDSTSDNPSVSDVTGENGKTTSQSGGTVDVNATGTSSGDNTTDSQQGNVSTNQQTPSSSQSQQGSQDVVNPQTPSSSAGVSNQQTPSSSQGQQGSQNVANPQTPSSSQGQQGTTTQTPGVPQNPQTPEKVNKIDYYQKIFKSGNFMMKVNDPDLGPVTMAMSGNKMFVEASMEGLSLKMIYDGDKPDEDNPQMGTWYIVIDKIKKYSPMPADMFGDMNVEELTKDFAKGDSNTVYTTSVETVNGEQLECESCVDSNGNTTKYYFRGDQLVRSDSISPSGAVSTTEFQEIHASVDESIFAIPDGYAKWDISGLIKMMG